MELSSLGEEESECEFLPSSGYPCGKEQFQWEADSAGGRAERQGRGAIPYWCLDHCRYMPWHVRTSCLPGRAPPWRSVGICRLLCTGAAPHSSASCGDELSRSGQAIAELQVQLFPQQECVYYLSTCLQTPTPVFTFYLLKFYWCFQLRNWFSFPLLKQNHHKIGWTLCLIPSNCHGPLLKQLQYGSRERL